MNKSLDTILSKSKVETSAMNGWYKVNKSLAKALLQLNTNNYRNVNHEKVKAWIEDMKNGNWMKNGETIVVGKNGVIQDGQHRLHAVVESDAEITAYIIFDADVTSLYDLNMVRTVNTMFRANQIPVNNLNTGTGRMVLCEGTSNICRGNMTVYNYVYDHLSDIKKAESIITTGYSSKNKPVNGVAKKTACATVVYCLLRTGEMSEAEMRSFFYVMNIGKKGGVAKDVTSAKVLRKQFLNMKGGGRALQKKQLEITYKALRDFKLNNHRVGEYDDDTFDAVRLIKQVMYMDHINHPEAA